MRGNMKTIGTSIGLAIILAFFAGSAFAAITNTKHDLSSGSSATIKGNSTELCVYCHTPHGADTTVTLAPLWNRDLSVVASVTNVYTSSTLTAETAGVVTTEIDATDAPLCMSCHDGSHLTDALKNPPNSGGGVVLVQVGANATINADMRDDHPIGFDYTLAQGADTELKTKAAAEGTLGTGALSYGGGNDMWCSSCHDVHGVTGVATFLRVDNTGSALCIGCHSK